MGLNTAQRATLLTLTFSGAAAVGLEAQKPPERQMFAGEWEVRSIVAGRVDSDLLNPSIPVVQGDAVTIFDYGDSAVKSFRISDGALLWKFGRRGAGPGEFRGVTDMRADSAGMLWVMDRDNNRITILTTTGTISREIRLETSIWRLALLPDVGYVGYRGTSGAPYLVRFGPAGERRGDLAVPAWVDQMDGMAKEGWLTSAGGGVVLGLMRTGRLIHYSWPSLRPVEIQAVETAPAPREIVFKPAANVVGRKLGPDAIMVIRRLSTVGNRLYVHVGGTSSQAGRLIDAYDLTDGRYRGTHLLPRPAKAAVATAGGFIVLETDFLPTLYLLTPKR